MKDYRTTLGGAISAAGACLFGGPIALSVSGVKIPDGILAALVIAGFLLGVLGTFLTALFAADARGTQQKIDDIHAKIDQTNQAVDEAKRISSGNTTFLEKTETVKTETTKTP